MKHYTLDYRHWYGGYSPVILTNPDATYTFRAEPHPDHADPVYQVDGLESERAALDAAAQWMSLLIYTQLGGR